MGLINWDLVTPRNSEAPSRELASITGLLSAFADRRDKMAAEQAARQQAEAHFQTQMGEKYADNARDERLRQQQMQVQRDQMAAAQKQHEDERQRKLDEDRRKVTPDIYSALQNQNPDLARMTAESYGGRLEPYQAPHVQAIDDKPQLSSATFANGNADAQQAQDAMSAVDNYQDTKAADTENTRRDQATKGIYGLSFPGTMETFMSDLADQRARLARGQQGAGIVDELGKTYGDTPAAKQAIQEVRAGVLSGALPPDKDAIYKAIAARRQSLDQMENATHNAGIRAANQGQVTPTQHVDDVRADVTQFRQDYSSWEKNNNVDKLTDTYDQFTNMKNAVANAKDTGDVIGQRAALYQAARLITGPGVLTAQEFNNTVQSTSGVLASAISKVRKQLDGEISDQEAAALEKFVMNQNGNVKAAALRKLHNFDRHYGTGSYFTKTVPDQVNAERQSFMDRFGITEADTKPPKSSGPTTDEDARMRRAGF